MADIDGPGFEGPEKKFEIDFRRKVGVDEGLFMISDETWQKLLDKAHCTIIGKKQSEGCKMYVLSESSLFVYRRRLVIKTCGITTLLEMIPPLLDLVGKEKNEWNAELSECLGLETEYMSYSRKNFLWPERQPKPHGSFHEEIAFLETYFENGSGYVLGPLNKEHWNFFIADYTRPEDALENPPDQTFEIIMSGLSKERMAYFFNEDGTKTAESVTADSEIDTIIPGSVIDAKIFEPCGYSMNGLTGTSDHYWTIHITPEHHCSYVSFETNLPLKNYTELVQRVLHVFQPEKCVITLFADHHSIPASPVSTEFSQPSNPLPASIPGMKLRHKTNYDFGEPYMLTLLDFTK
eukprot:TRINITY_DN1137_c1_g2_i1.p1 TRINITY_DN1137_c1_g2~~TRINITY_DN1137_c1_g2_i1.p1  ORF type:complete len:370 (+),score=58.33 TRINITY_DN1137_c1_g2_i1:63-1112(+)